MSHRGHRGHGGRGDKETRALSHPVLDLCFLCVLWAALLCSGTASAQDGDDFPPPYEPPEPVRLGPYVTTGEVEIGYRFTALDGSREAYRSVVDLPRNLVLGFSRIELRAPENSGPVFDELVVEGSGGPGEPTSSFRTKVARRSLYAVDYRRSRIDTFNFLPDFANPLFSGGIVLAPHGWDRSRRTDALDVTIFPERRIEGRFSYFRSDQSGLGLGTDISDERLVFDRELDNRAHEVRGGVSLRLARWSLLLEQGARFYEDDERDTADPFTVTDPETLAGFRRLRTTDYDAPTSRAVLTGSPFDELKLTARATYVDYDVRASLAESLDSIGSDPSESLVDGRTEGHAFLFDSSQDWRVTDRLRVANYLRYRRYRNSGETSGIFTFAGDTAGAVRENALRDYRDARVEDELLAEYEPFRGLVVRGGYRFARRTFDLDRTDATLLAPPNEQFSTSRALSRSDEQRLDAVIAGGSFRFRRDVRVFLEYENGREPNPNWGLDERRVFFEKAGDYRLLRLRASYAVYDWLEVAGSVRTHDRSFVSGVIPGREVIVDDPFNPVFVRLFDGEPPAQQTRSRAASVTVRARPWASASFGVTYDHLHNTAGITFLRAVEEPSSPTGFESVYRYIRYVDDEELVTADATVDPVEWATLSGFYSLVSAEGSLRVRYHQASLRGLVRFTDNVGGFLEWRLYDYDRAAIDVTDFTANHVTAGVRWQW